MYARQTLDRSPWAATARRLLLLSALVAALLIGATTWGTQTAYAAGITVDGTTCTLADAITAANTDTATGGCVTGSGADTIDLQADVTLTSALPDITSEITLNGNGHTIARDSAASNFRILFVNTGGNLTLNRATLANGIAQEYPLTGRPIGGGLLNYGTTTINDSIIRDNGAFTGGGGLANYHFATLTINNSTIRDNGPNGISYLGGAGILNWGGTVTINNSTVSNNSGGDTIRNWQVNDFSGADSFTTIRNSTIRAVSGQRALDMLGGGNITVDSSTIVGQSTRSYEYLIVAAGGGTTPGNAAIVMRNSIAFDMGSGGAPVCLTSAVGGATATITSDGHNLVSDSSCGFTGTGDQQSVSAADLKLGPLADNGGPTQTYALLPGSAAIDAGNTTLTTDQRGVTRPQNAADDIGAFEAESCPSGPWSVANEAELNAAIFCYNNETTPGIYTVTLTSDIDLTASTTTINNATSGVSLVIEGAGHAVDGQGIAGVRPFEIAASTAVKMNRLTIRGGNIDTADGAGGGIFNRGSLELFMVTVSGNTAEFGGGIRNEGNDAFLRISQSTISGNTAAGMKGEGGGINNGSGGTMSIDNSTISGNTAATWGGGISTAGGADNFLDSTTVAANSVPPSTLLDGSGIHIGVWGNLSMINTLVADNTGGSADLNLSFGTFVDNGHNLVESTSGRATVVDGANGNIVGRDPKLGPLADNGGPTETHALLAGSPAIDAGDTTLTTDQRGETRPFSSADDIGAYESQADGTVIIKKSTAPAGGVNFGFVITDTQGVASTFTLSDTEIYTLTNATPGAYVVVEDEFVGGRLAGIQCDDTNGVTPSTGDPATRTANINVSPGETVTCAFTNTADDIIIISKSTYPANGTGFDFTSNVPGGSNFTLDDDEFEFFAVTPGTYTFTETNPGLNWELGVINCTVLAADPNDPPTSVSGDLQTGSVTLVLPDPGQAAYCVFTNLGLGSITIEKDAQPADNVDFNFSSPQLGNFTLNGTSPVSQTFDLVSGGIYTITETATNGWSLDQINCQSTSGNSFFDVDRTNGQLVLDLDEGDDVSCSFVNKEQGSITIVKDANPNDGTQFTFDQNIDGSGAFTLTHAISKTFSSVAPQTYTFTEMVPSGWDLALVKCEAASGNTVSTGIDYVNNNFSVQLEPGEDVTCTVSNKLYASLTINKVTEGGDDTFNFTSGFFPVNSFDLTTVGGTATRTFSDLPSIQTYSINETAQPGWVLAEATCDNGDTPDSVRLDPGDNVTCTFRNKKTGSITITKDANPNDGTQFVFDQNIDSSGSFTLTHAMSTTFSSVAPAQYRISETLSRDWYMSLVNCQAASGNNVVTGIDYVNNYFTVDLDPGEDVTCTVANKQYASLTIKKEAVGGDDTFNFTSPFFPENSFNLTTVGGTIERTFGQLPSNVGAYSVTETAEPGWVSTSATCDNGDTPDALFLAPGDDVTCTFVNEKQGSLTVVKDAVGSDATFDFTSQALGNFALKTAGGVAKRTFGGLIPGAYDLTETALTGWTQAAATCDNGSTLPTVNVGPGEHVTCRFENQQQNMIVVNKLSIGGDGIFTFNSPQFGTFNLKTRKGNIRQFFGNLAPGTYSVSETVPAGWTAKEADPICSNGDKASAITLTAGETVLCTFVNLKQDTLTVEKRTVAGDGAFDFNSPQLGSFSLNTVGGSTSQSFTGLNSGLYVITETVPAGWAQSGTTCSNGDDPTNVTMLPGANITCVFTNTKLSSITLVKNATGGDGSFNFSGDLGSFALTTTAGRDQQTFANLAAGTYAITETVPAGWDLTGVRCSDGSPVGAIALGVGEDVTCLFENTKRGSLTIIKNATGGDAVFSFTSPKLGGFDITTTNGTGQQIFADLVPGIYNVAETVPSGWQLDGVPVCDNGSLPGSVSVGPGEHVTCTFKNAKQNTIVVVKRATGGDDTFGFNFAPYGIFTLTTVSGQAQVSLDNLIPGPYSISEDPLTGWTQVNANPVCSNGDPANAINLGVGETVTCVFENMKNDSITVQKRTIGGDGTFDFTGDLGSFVITTTNGTAGSNFGNLTPGTYGITETVPAGWVQTAASCDNGDPASGVSLAAGESTICTFENTKLGKIVVQKRAIGGDGTFVFGGDFGSFDLKTAGTAVKRDFFDVAPGTYTITETVQPGWDQTFARCTNGSDPSSIVITAGEEVTCFFVNTRRGSLTVVKETTGGDGVFNFTSTALGNFALTTSSGVATRSFADLTPGTFAVSETVPAGWALTSASCDNGDDPASITLAAAETVTCRFVNTKEASLTIVKQTVSGDGVFNFTSAALGNFALTTSSGTAQRTFDNLTPGAYSVTEMANQAWELVGASCDNGDSPANLTLGAGDNVTCVFENRKRTLYIYLPQIFYQQPQVPQERNLYLPLLSHTRQQVVYASNFSSGVGSGWSTGTTMTTSPSGATFLGEFGASVARSQDSARAIGTSLSLTDLPAHSRVTVSLDLYVIRSWDGNQEDLPPAQELREILAPAAVDGTVGPDRWLMKQGGQTLLDTSFSNIAAFTQAYPAAFGAANNPAQSGSTVVNSLGYTYQGSPMDATYRIVQSFAHNADSLVLSFEALGLQISEDESWGIDNVTVTVE